METDLDGADARVAQRQASLHTLLRAHQLAARRVRVDPIAISPEQLPQRLARGPRDEIPHRHLEDPVATVVQVDGLDDPVDRRRVGRVDTDEKALEELAVGQRVPARIALDAVVGAHDRDRRLLLRPWHRIPGDADGRIERVAVAPRFDRRDAHRYSPV